MGKLARVWNKIVNVNIKSFESIQEYLIKFVYENLNMVSNPIKETKLLDSNN